METIGVISEYNPFHNGHKLHIDKTIEATKNDNITVVMSGNFVQRGEPAIMDKWSRARCALLNGASIVLELPSTFSSSSAEMFALGAMKILNSCGIVSHVSFGSESGNIEQLKKAASVLSEESLPFSLSLKQNLRKGMSFPSARQKALEETYGDDFSFISSPNNILAVEYIKSISRLNSKIVPLTFKREGEEYNSKNISRLASASALRKAVKENNIEALKLSMPETACKTLLENIESKNAPIFIDDFYQSISYVARIKPGFELAKIYGIDEGLENRIKNAFSAASSIDEAISLVKSKRYTHTAIQRIFIHMLLDIKSEYIKEYSNCSLPYIRVLGFRKEKEYIIRHLIEKSDVPVVINMKKAFETLDESALRFLKAECTFTDIYFMASKNALSRHIGQEFTKQIVIV
ncbi:MAG: nucleotidyltransferase [Firmicutes bacterium]|nr:nucleotidyltransferase [Bacillota bacterium]